MDSGSKPVNPAPKKAAANAVKSGGKPPAPGTKPAPAKPGQKPATQAAAQTVAPVQRTSATDLWKEIKSGPTERTMDILRSIIIIEVMIIMVLTLAFTYAKFKIPRDPIPFAINSKTGEPKVIRALHIPTQTPQAIMSWVGSASADILNFGFHNIYTRLDGTRKYFTEDGWTSFSEAIKKSGIIDKIVTKQQVITAAPIGTPVILRSRENPIYGKEWTVQVPISVTILSGKETDSRKRTLTLVLVSVPPEQNLAGLGIDRWLETQ